MITCENYTGGEWTGTSSGSVIESFNPATGELVGTAPTASAQDVQNAVAAARNAFETSNWAENSQLRTRVLNNFAREILNRIDDLGRLLTDENGKVIADAQYEVDRGAGIVEYYAGMAQNVLGRTSMPIPNLYSFVVREPLGVAGLIVPFNFPVVLLLRALAPALAAGNAVIIKPAFYTPAITYELVRILSEIDGIPPGIVNLIAGSNDVGAELVRNPDVDIISVTGSTNTGKLVMKEAAKNLTRVSLELGGKSPNIIFDDADIERAITQSLKGSWITFSGQVCYAGTRLIIQDGIYDRFLRELKDRAEKLKLGYGIHPETEMGPVIDKKQISSVLDFIETGKKDANLVTGGYVRDDGDLARGNFIAPTIFDQVPVDSRINREEVFGPVLSVFRFSEADEAIEIANSTEYGLAGAVWTRDINQAFRVARRVKSGIVWVNNYGKLPYQAVMGGYKQSGIGRQYGEEGLNEFTQLKHIAVDIGDN